jgi:hypothetical protein
MPNLSCPSPFTLHPSPFTAGLPASSGTLQSRATLLVDVSEGVELRDVPRWGLIIQAGVTYNSWAPRR